MAHLGLPPITIDKTFEHGTIDEVSSYLCHSIIDYIFSSSYILERSDYSTHEQI
jgi:hypothetical protein